MLAFALLIVQTWVVKQAIPPEPRTSGTELGYGPFIAVGDLDGDAAVESYVQAADTPFSEQYLGFLRGGMHQSGTVFGIAPFVFKPGGSGVPRIAILNTPQGMVVAYHDLRSGLLQTRRFPDVHHLVAISPNLQPGAFVRFPDVNGDGWEDLFCQDYLYEGYPMIVDGRTLTAIWRNVLPDSENPSMLTRNTAKDPQDIDGDLVPDPIAVWTKYYSQTGTWDHSIQAFSGATGTQLWENRAATSRGLTVPSVSEFDLTGDAVDDVILANSAVLKLVSGADGATVWSYDPTAALQAAGQPGWILDGPRPPAILTHVPRSGAVELILPIRYLENPALGIYRVELAHFDPYFGTFLGLALLPQDLMPWFADAFGAPRPDFVFAALGDLDRDGLQEISFPANAPAYDVVWNGFTPKHFVTLGLQTLEIPPQLQIGVAATAQVSIPSAPHHDFFLVASRTFDRRGGVRLDGWRTHLADDPWLTWSTASRAFAGTLDGSGNGQALVTMPSNPALIGTSLYTRAVVLAPGGQEIWTLSTLGISEIVP